MYLYIGIAIFLLLIIAYFMWPAPTQDVFANNGTVSCETYCKGNSGAPWNNELPAEWNGAKCVASSVGDCVTAPGLTTGLKCTCAKTGAGWA